MNHYRPIGNCILDCFCYNAATTPRKPRIPAAAIGTFVGAARAEEVLSAATEEVAVSVDVDAALAVAPLAEDSIEDNAAEAELDRLDRIDEASDEASDKTWLESV